MARLLGPDGQPIEPTRLKEEEATPSLGGVRQILADHPSAGLTPQRLAQLLRAAEDGDATAYLELAEDMEEKDLHYLGVLSTRKRQVAQLDITVDAASDSAEDVKIADFVRSLISSDDFEDTLFDVLDAVGKGYSATEIVWDMTEREWRPAKLIWRDPRWFAFDRNDGQRLMLRIEANEEGGETGVNVGLRPLSPFKFIIHRHRAKSGLPIRGGLARAVAWAYMFRNFAVKDWVAFAEIYGQPIRVGKYHPGATDNEKRALLRAVAGMGTDASAIIPNSMVIELLGDQARRDTGDLYEKLAKFLEQQISKAVLGQTGTTDAIAGGYAVGKVQNDVRGDIERADAKQLAATLGRDLARPAIDLNFGPQKAYPKIRIGRPEAVDMDKMATVLARLVPMGLRVETSVIRDKLGLPEPAEGAEVLTPPAAPPSPFDALSPPADKEAIAARAAARASEDDAINNLADDALEEWEPLVDQLTEPVRKLLGEVKSLDELRERLPELVQDMDPEDIAELLARALFNARLAGETDAPIGE